jgi:hypothetical protein
LHMTLVPKMNGEMKTQNTSYKKARGNRIAITLNRPMRTCDKKKKQIVAFMTALSSELVKHRPSWRAHANTEKRKRNQAIVRQAPNIAPTILPVRTVPSHGILRGHCVAEGSYCATRADPA